jgi:hypothetical protein
MKHFLREPVLAGLALPPAERQPKKLRLVHAGSGDVVDLGVEFTADGTATSEWAIPKTARLGTYQVQLVIGEDTIESGQLRVEAYRLPLLRGKLQGPKRPAIAGAPLELDFALAYLAGGPASRLPVELRTQIRSAGLAEVDGFEGYVFLRGDVKAGLERWEDDFDFDDPSPARPVPPAARPLTLDAEGGIRTAIEAPPASDTPQQLVAEMSFRDPNGEIQTIARTIPVYPSERMIGLRLSPHRSEGEPLRLDVALVDLERRPVRGHVEVELFERKVYSHRKRLVGGFYAFEHAAQTSSLGLLCAGRTDRHGRYGCSAPLTATGQLFVRATARDAEGRLAATHESLWIPGSDDDWYEASDADRMDLFAEKQQVEPGERARIACACRSAPRRRSSRSSARASSPGVRDPALGPGPASSRLPLLRSATRPTSMSRCVAIRGRVSGWRLWLADLASALAPALLPRSRGETDRAGRPRASPASKPRRHGAATSGWRRAPPRGRGRPPTSPERYRVARRVPMWPYGSACGPDGRPAAFGRRSPSPRSTRRCSSSAPNDSWQICSTRCTGERPLRRRDLRARTLQVVGKRHYGRKARRGGGRRRRSSGGQRARIFVPLPRSGKAASGSTRGASARVAVPLSTTRCRPSASPRSRPGTSDQVRDGQPRGPHTTQDLMASMQGVAPLVRAGDRVRRGALRVRNGERTSRLDRDDDRDNRARRWARADLR